MSTILVQRDLKAKAEQKKTKEEAILEEIGEKVHEICLFGSTNLPGPKEIEKGWSKITEPASVILFSTPTDQETQDYIVEQRHILASTGSYFGIPVDKVGEYFVEFSGDSSAGTLLMNPKALYPMLQSIGTMVVENDMSDLVDIIKLFCNRKNLKPYIACLALHWSKYRDRATLKDKAEMIKIGEHYSQVQKKEPTTSPHREQVFKYMLHDVIQTAFNSCFGNCQIMAECAFLLTIQKLDTPCRYIQFTDSKGKYEELNAVVVGTWPKPDCLVLAPWKSKVPFVWKGTFESTEVLKLYDSHSILFSAIDDTERLSFNKILETERFDVEALLKSTKRNTQITYVTKMADKISGLCEALLLDEPEAGEKLGMS